MSILVEQLKKEHTVLADALGMIKKAGISSGESKQMLLDAKKALLDHIGKEDSHLYPELKKAAEQNPEIERKLKSFAKDMDEITQFVIQFFTKVETNSYAPLDYAKDFGKLMAVLSSRISREENILYPMYDSLNK